MDARLVDAGSRAAGLLERAEAMRREMREISRASRGATAEASSATDPNVGPVLECHEAPEAEAGEASASTPFAETARETRLGLGRERT